MGYVLSDSIRTSYVMSTPRHTCQTTYRSSSVPSVARVSAGDGAYRCIWRSIQVCNHTPTPWAGQETYPSSSGAGLNVARVSGSHRAYRCNCIFTQVIHQSFVTIPLHPLGRGGETHPSSFRSKGFSHSHQAYRCNCIYTQVIHQSFVTTLHLGQGGRHTPSVDVERDSADHRAFTCICIYR